MAPPIQHIAIAHTWDGCPVGAHATIHLHLEAKSDGLSIAVDAPFLDDPVAPTQGPGTTERLWEYEVVELFVAGPRQQYTEIEMGPHGHHLVLQLDGIRNPTASGLDIDFSATRTTTRWQGVARVPWILLPNGPHRVNATAIHGSGEERTYLSWQRLAGDAPDFHQLDQFAEVTLPGPPP